MSVADQNSQVVSSPAQQSTSDREIVLSRVFDAPRELVFTAWTDTQHVAEWWGPYVAREYHAVEMGNQTLTRFAEHLATRAPQASPV